MSVLRRFLLAGICFVFSGRSSAEGAETKPKSPMDFLDDRILIETGDRMSVRILDDRREPTQPVVTEDGNIEVPYIGRTKAAGLTCRKLAYEIRDKLKRVPAHTLPFRLSDEATVVTVIDNIRGCPPGMDDLDHSTKLRSGYDVTIQIIEYQHEPLLQRVSDSGEIHVPYLGTIKAEGLACRELAYRLKAGLEKNFFKTATVMVSSHFSIDNPTPVAWVGCPREPDSAVVFGSVVRQGKYDLPSDHDTSVSALLIRTGGYTGKNAVPKIRVIRKTPQGNKRILVNAKAVLIEKRSEFDLFLRPDDVVIVE